MVNVTTAKIRFVEGIYAVEELHLPILQGVLEQAFANTR